MTDHEQEGISIYQYEGPAYQDGVWKANIKPLANEQGFRHWYKRLRWPVQHEPARTTHPSLAIPRVPLHPPSPTRRYGTGVSRKTRSP